MRRLLRRGAKFWKGSLVVLVLGGAAALLGALHVARTYRSECTIFAKPRIRTDDRDDSSTSPEALARQAARLKDMLTTRGRLEAGIRRFHLYPTIVAQRTMLDAVEQMKPHVGFRSLEGGQYVISFDGDDPDAVEQVTRYLSESLIEDYAAGDVKDLQMEADFLAQEEERSVSGLEDATRALTLFLADHPEFALEAKQAATTPFGPSPAAGIPLLPKADGGAPVASGAAGDAALAALFRQRARLEGEARAVGAAVPRAPASSAALDEQIAQAQGQVEAAAKRAADTQADLASKSNLTEDHPDMRAARMAAAAAARQLHEAKVQLAALQQLKASGAALAAPAPADAAQIPREMADRMRQLDAQIAARRAQLGHGQEHDHGTAATPAVSAGPVVSAVVELETEWQRLLRALSDARSHHDDLKARAERATLALGAARSQASERMAILDPPYRPTHPAKGGRANVALGGLAMAWLLALAWAGARAALDDTLVDADDVTALSLGPVLGEIPRIREEEPRAAA